MDDENDSEGNGCFPCLKKKQKKPANDNVDTKEPANDNSDTEEPANDNSDTEEPANDNSDTGEPANDNSDTGKENVVYPDVEIQKILQNHTDEEIGSYASTELQKLRTSIYKTIREKAGKDADVKIQLYVCRYDYVFGSGNITIVINITEKSMDIEVRRPLKSGDGMLSSILETIKNWWKSVIKHFLE